MLFLSAHILLSLINLFKPTVFLKLRYRDIAAFRTKKIEWMSSWSLTHCNLHISRCDMEKHCLIIFNAFGDAINTFQAWA